jgi:hypothetical protein
MAGRTKEAYAVVVRAASLRRLVEVGDDVGGGLEADRQTLALVTRNRVILAHAADSAMSARSPADPPASV